MLTVDDTTSKWSELNELVELAVLIPWIVSAGKHGKTSSLSFR